MRSFSSIAFVVPLVACGLACSASKDSGSGDNPLGGGDSGVGFHLDGGDGGFNGDGLDPDAGPTENDCPEDLKQIYVVTEGNDLYRFAPATLTFTRIGTLSCPSSGFATPFSMAVQRNGTAWVLFNDGIIFHVSTKDASCGATAYVPGQNGYTTFGMAL